MFSFFLKKRVDPQKKLKKVLKGYKLPSFPATIAETLARLRNPDSSVESIAEIISLDPGVSVRVLGFANSPVFSPIQKITTMKQAITVIGLTQLESLVLSAGVTKCIPKVSSKSFNMRDYWLAAARRAVIARALSPVVSPGQDAESFTAGLLQDMAIPFLFSHMPERYGKIIQEWQNSDQPLVVIERDYFDWDHAEVATWICNEWGLPETIASAIGGHHDINNSLYRCPPSVYITSVVRQDPENAGIDELIKTAVDQFNLSPEKVKRVIDTSLKNANDIFRMMI